MPDLESQVVLVTGAASGIGRATASLAARQGAVVVLADVDQGGAEAAAGALRACGLTARARRLDVGSSTDWSTLLEDVMGREGRLDALVGNAGLARFGPLVDTSLEDWRLLKKVMLEGLYLGVTNAAPLIAAGGGGAIVNVLSVHALAGEANQAAYSAIKAAARAFSRGAARAWAPKGVRINQVLPGPVTTSIFENIPAELRVGLGPRSAMIERKRKTVPLLRYGEPDEIAQCVCFLLSSCASFIVGADMVADGGLTA